MEELKKYIPNYVKGRGGKTYSLLKSNLDCAMKNAKDLESKKYETFCNVHKILEDIGMY